MKNIILFDYDGVIADSMELGYKLCLEASKKNGVQVIKSKEHFMEIFSGNFFDKMRGLGLSAEEIQEIVRFTNKGRLKAPVPDTFAGINDVIEKLSQDNLLYVITSAPEEVVSRDLQSQGLAGYFQEVLGPNHNQSKLAKINSIKEKYPDRKIYFISDTTGDIIEGKEANVETIGVTWGWHDEAKMKQVGPSLIVDSVPELMPIFSS